VLSAFMDAFPKTRILLQTSPFRDEVQVPVDPADHGAAARDRVAFPGTGARIGGRCRVRLRVPRAGS